MIKRNKSYLFLIRNFKGNLLILSGAATKKVENHPLKYFYDHLESYVKSIQSALNSYFNFQKEVSKEIKKIGGYGTIHGCIVDIDKYNHIYVEPLHNNLIYYFATNIKNVQEYSNLKKLLKNNNKLLYDNLKKLKKNSNKESYILTNSLNKCNNNFDNLYKISRIMKQLKCTFDINIVKVWNDEWAINTHSPEENGKNYLNAIYKDD